MFGEKVFLIGETDLRLYVDDIIERAVENLDKNRKPTLEEFKEQIEAIIELDFDCFYDEHGISTIVYTTPKFEISYIREPRHMIEMIERKYGIENLYKSVLSDYWDE